MDNDWDLELSHQIDSHQTLQQSDDVEPDLMLQPITTQEKFNVKHKNKPSPQKVSPSHPHPKQINPVQQGTANEKFLKDSQQLAEEARKFRQYLNDKVQELRKSKDQNNLKQNFSPQSKSKASNLRKIINKEELKSKQNPHQKTKSTSQIVAISKQPSLVNRTAVELPKGHETNTSSVGNYKNEKKFSNSQSSLAKNNQKKDAVNSKNSTVTDIKKSINLDQSQNPKTPKLPELTPKLKIPFPTKSEAGSTQQHLDKRKSTIDSAVPKGTSEKQKRRTPESKNSFRIKRTSNAPNNQTNSQPNQQKLSLQVKKSNEGSFKTIEKQKQRKQAPSPVHQGKNRKMREDFIRFNEEQKAIQDEILKNHQPTKQQLDSMMKKYQLSSNAYQKYGIKKQAQFPNQPQAALLSPKKNQAKESRINPTQKQISEEEVPKESALKKEERKNKFLDEELQKINSLLKARDQNIKKYESRVEKNPLMQFIKSLPEDILEESEDDENDKVEELPGQKMVRPDPKYDQKEFSSTYSSVMTEMKNKKWGLKQRITFETHRDQPEPLLGGKMSSLVSETNIPSSNKKFQQSSRFPEILTNDDQNNQPSGKIQVNSRLKNLLLD